jgi:hypothetical protein
MKINNQPKNYEIRFKTSKEIYSLSKQLSKDYFYELKRRSFFEKVFVLGLEKIKQEVRKQNEQPNNK